MSEDPRYIFAVSHSLYTHIWWLRPPTSSCEELDLISGLFGVSRPICVFMCVPWESNRDWPSILHLAITSVLPYYDSLHSHPKPSYPKNRLSFANFNGSTVGEFWKARRPVLPVARRYYRCLESSPPRNSSTATATIDTRYPVLPVSPGGTTAGRQ